MRSTLLTGLSLALTTSVIANAYYQRTQFYPSVVYLTKSNGSMVIIYLQAFVLVSLLGRAFKKIFFGTLRPEEFEHLVERSWFAVTETCLAFTVFKDDFSPKFVALFTLLLFLKSFHWLLEDRVDSMDRSPLISKLFHLRVLSLLTLLSGVDALFVLHAISSTLQKGASVQLVFGFEYGVLLTSVTNTLIKYILHNLHLHSSTPWENKAVFMLYTEVVIGFIKTAFYILFVAIMVRIDTLPLFAVRPMYLTMRAFKKALNDIILSRRAIHNMNTRYPDATPEELESSDNVCIICREDMLAPSTKKLPCNHIFHKSCLRSWFQRQQTCPTCRLNVLRVLPTRLTTTTNVPDGGGPHQGGAGAGHQQGGGAAAAGLPGALPPFMPFPPHFFGNLGGAPGGAPVPPMPSFRPPTSTNTQNTSSSPPLYPSFSPFFHYPNYPNVPPPPLPPRNFSGLSPEELLAMEGQERQNIEARIGALRNIQVLLDAAVLEMSQYSAVFKGLSVKTEGDIIIEKMENKRKKRENEVLETKRENEESETYEEDNKVHLRQRRLEKFNSLSSSSSSSSFSVVQQNETKEEQDKKEKEN